MKLLTLLFISAVHGDAYHAMWTRLFVKVFLSIWEDRDLYGVTVSTAEYLIVYSLLIVTVITIWRVSKNLVITKVQKYKSVFQSIYGSCYMIFFSLFAMQEVELPDRANVKEEKDLVILNSKLQTYWKFSPYYLEDTVPESKR